MKERLTQKSSWLGLGTICFALYRAIVLKDFALLPEAISTGLGLVAVNA